MPLEDIFLENFFEVVLSLLSLEGKLLVNTIGQLVHVLGRIIIIFLAELSCALHSHLIPLQTNLDPFNLLDFVKLLELSLCAPSG